ncbi:MAG: hypothetical protein KatS3mg111_0401 [Pirellulaceae bacterium]|nr:MAG: hypothetical protein KatS3mg111_0401 [Pirellulaceae bacterium]
MMRQTWHDRWSWIRQFAVLGWLWLGSLGCLHAQSVVAETGGEGTAEWQVMKIYAPADQISRIVSSDYVLISLDELDAALRESVQRKRVATTERPYLREAVYVARLERNQLVSDLSRWTFAGRTRNGPFNVGDLSLALTAPRGLPTTNDSLLEHMVVNPGGDLLVDWSGPVAERWFGFSVVGEGNQFDVRIPPAAAATMLVSTPQLVEIDSPDVVIERLDSLADHLPPGWPLANVLLGSQVGRQWWILRLSGTHRFKLTLRTGRGVDDGRAPIIARAAQIEYRLGVAETLIQSRYELAPLGASGALALQVETGVRLRSVLSDGATVRWRVRPGSIDSSAADATVVVDLLSDQETPPKVIEVTATAPAQPMGPLPEIHLENCTVLSGWTRIVADPDLVVTKVQSERGVAVASRATSPSPPLIVDRPAGSAAWELAWVKQPPALVVESGRTRSQWVAESLTRLSLQSDWLSARCRVRLQCSDVRHNTVQMSVGQGWYVDSVQLVDSAAADIKASYELPTVGDTGGKVVIQWELSRPLAQVEVEVVAHRHQPGGTEILDIFSAGAAGRPTKRLLTLPNAEQYDHYAIEPSTVYRLQPSSELLAYQEQLVDLPPWQQRLLPEAHGRWIFFGVRSSIPPIRFQARESRISCRSLSLVQHDAAGDRYRVFHLFDLRAAEGSLPPLEILLPADASYEQWSWYRMEGGLPVPVSPEQVRLLEPATSDQGRSDPEAARRPRMQLRHLAGSNLLLLGGGPSHLTAEGKSTIDLPIPAVPQATSASYQVLIPAAWELQAGNEFVELSRPETSCNAEHLSVLSSLAGMASVPLGELVCVNVTGAPKLPIVATPLERPPRFTGWVEQQVVRQLVHQSGRIDTHLSWELSLGRPADFLIELPADWTLAHLIVDGRPIWEPTTNQRVVRLSFPQPGPHQVAMTCRRHHQDTLPWLHRLPETLPSVNLAIRHRSNEIELPPDWVSLATLFTPTGDRLYHRLWPAAWWSWLLIERWPADLPTATPSSSASSNAAIPPLLPPALASYYVARPAVAIMVLGLVIVSTSLLWWVVGWSARLAWFLLGLAIVVLIAVPIVLVAIMQVFVLSLALAIFLRMLGKMTSRSATSSPRTRVTSLARGSSIVGGCLLTMILPPVPENRALAQTNGNGVGGSAMERGGDPPVYGVLIPIDEQGEIAGSYVYIPQELRQRLDNPDDAGGRRLAAGIRSAQYELRTNPATTSDGELAQQLVAKYEIVMPPQRGELRIPILQQDLRLLRYEVDSTVDQEAGLTVSPEPDHIVVQSPVAGVFSLRLFFSPTVVTDENGAAHLSAQIPIVANAMLRVLTDSTTRVAVRAIGRQVRTGNELVVHLGPTDELDCSWSSPAAEPAESNTRSEIYVWTYAHRGGVLAAHLTRVFGRLSPFRELHLSLDSNWEPISRQCGDVELVETGVMPIGNRRVYVLRPREEWTRKADAPLEILMLLQPTGRVSSSSLPLPLATLQELPSPKQATVTFSIHDSSWSLPDSTQWMAVPTPTTVWQQRAFPAAGTSYLIPIDSTPILRSQSTAGAVGHVESTHVRIHRQQMMMQFEAVWNDPLRPAQPLRILLPQKGRVETLAVDGAAAPYRVVHTPDDGRMLVLMPNERLQSIRRLTLEITLPVRFQHPGHLSKPVLVESTPQSSQLRISRRFGLQVQLEYDSEEIQQVTAPVRNTAELLSQLEIDTAALSLSAAISQQTDLPIEITVDRAAGNVPPESCIVVQKDTSGWTGRLLTAWDADESPLDFLFLDVPEELRESLDVGPLARRFIPSGNKGRVTLCILPPEPDEQNIVRVEVRFPIRSSAVGQQLTLPEVRLIYDGLLAPCYAFPHQLGESEIRWEVPGQPAALNGLTAAFEQSHPHVYHIDSIDRIVAWRRVEDLPSNASILVSRLDIENTGHGDQVLQGRFRWWIDPGNEHRLSIRFPPGMRVVGARFGDQRPVPLWTSEQGQQIDVLLVPNTLPLRLEVAVEIAPLFSPRGESSLQLAAPELRVGSSTWQGIHVVTNHHPQVQVPASGGSSTDPLPWVLHHWVATVLESSSRLAAHTSAEREDWLRMWSPEAIGVDRATPLPKGLDVGWLEDADQTISTVGDFWAGMIGKVAPDSDLGERADAASMAAAEPAPASSVLFTPPATEVVLRSAPLAAPAGSKWLAASLTACAFLLAYLLARRIRQPYMQLLNRAPWLWWMQLSILSSILFPTLWPAALLGLVGLWWAIRQWWNWRRAVVFR